MTEGVLIQPKPDEGGRIFRCNHSCPLYRGERGCEVTGHCHAESEVCEPWLLSVTPKAGDSALIVTFAAPGSAEFHMKPVGAVTPGQLGALGANLSSRADFMVKSGIQANLVQPRGEQQPRILVPGVDPRAVDDVLRRMAS